jgi:hypothetical protein
MTVHSRLTPFLAVIGALALGGASVAGAQDTSAAARSDTSGYRGYQNRTDTAQAGQANTRTDSTGFKYTGPATDTTLKAKPGAQTGPTAGDTGAAAGKTAAAADTVACKDGSNAVKGKQACAEHGGVDWAATRAAMKARGKMMHHHQAADSAAARTDTSAGTGADTGQVNKTGAAGYKYNGASSDTALKAKPGTQTGPDTGAAAKSDSVPGSHQNP